jgi:hypothetical protein
MPADPLTRFTHLKRSGAMHLAMSAASISGVTETAHPPEPPRRNAPGHERRLDQQRA